MLLILAADYMCQKNKTFKWKIAKWTNRLKQIRQQSY